MEMEESMSWYSKFFECWRNRNRVYPGRIELPDCDFFIVAPRRTLRILKPTLKSGWYYESTINKPELINDNFFVRWSKRPHSSGNCRCSFRQSAGVLNITEEKISAGLNRIRTSLCRAEKNTHIEQVKEQVSMNLQKLQNDSVSDYPNKMISSLTHDGLMEQNTKHQIVKDLERYINTLLEDILDDTVKHVAQIENNGIQNSEMAWQQTENTSWRSQSIFQTHSDKSKEEISAKRNEHGSFIDINHFFSEQERKWNTDKKCKNQIINPMHEGYMNPAFIGSTDGLTFLELDHPEEKHTNLYLESDANDDTKNFTSEQLDYVDSGINNVNTLEFQPDEGYSFEESFLRIIDEKLGRNLPINKSRDNFEKNSHGITPTVKEHQSDTQISSISSELKASNPESGKIKQLDTIINTNADFENVNLEFHNNNKDLSFNKKILSKLNTDNETKLMEIPPIELKDYKIEWSEFDEISLENNVQENPHDSITFRGNRKPTIVFLHGFGSSADIFEHQLQYFSSLGYPCIAPDMLGHGMSSAPGRSKDYHFNKLLKDLDAVLHHYAFKSGEKCVLVAHNYGCSFAAALAYKYDNNIHQLVLISGGGPTPLAPPSTESAGDCCLRASLAPFLMCGLHRDVLYSARGRQHPYCGHESVKQWPSHMKYILNGMVWPEGDYVFHRKICTPTLLIHGLRDNKVSLVQECQMERTMMKAFLEAIPMAGHNPMTECPQQLNHMIHCFIDLWKN